MTEKTETSLNTGDRVIPLSKPIMAHGEERTELSFREPTGADLAACGMPVKLSESFDVEFDTKKMAAMLAALSGVPPSSIGQLKSVDWTTCAWAITDFFVPDLATLLRMHTSSP